MHKYRVVELLTDENRVVFRCQGGRHHAARALGVLPPVKALLHGDKPHLGFGVLVCSQTHSMFRMMFESINETGLQSSASASRPAAPPSLRLSM